MPYGRLRSLQCSACGLRASLSPAVLDCQHRHLRYCWGWQCRKQTGHYLVTTEVTHKQFTLTGAEHVRWYRSSDKVRRGFCGTCGSVLFWEAVHKDRLWVTLGMVDGPTRTGMKMHIYVAQQGDSGLSLYCGPRARR